MNVDLPREYADLFPRDLTRKEQKELEALKGAMRALKFVPAPWPAEVVEAWDALMRRYDALGPHWPPPLHAVDARG